MVTDKVEIINKVIKECNINFDIKIDNGDVVDYLKNQKIFITDKYFELANFLRSNNNYLMYQNRLNSKLFH